MSPLWLVVFAAALAATVVPGAAASVVSPDEAVMTALKLATEYNNAVRPPPDNGSANTVNVFVYFTGIAKVDSAAQEVTLRIWLMTHWTDVRLSWFNKFNSTLDSIGSIILPIRLLWQPDVSFFEANDQKDVGNSRDLVLLSSNGTVLRSGGLVVTTKCRMQMRKFPFDMQTCSLRIGSVFESAGSTMLRIKPIRSIATEQFLTKSNEFCILGIDHGTIIMEQQAVPEFRITFQRMSTFYVVNLMLPSVLLLAISVIAFRLPPECGERISFSITIVLSMCVFLQLAGNFTPAQSESVPLITWYFSITVLMTMLNVLCNAFVLSCHFKKQSNSRINNRLIRALFFGRAVIGRASQAKISAADSSGPQPSETDVANQHEYNWATVGALADKASFIGFVFATIVLGFSLVLVQLSVFRTDCIGLL